MNDLEKRAHDIAVRILPRMIEEERLDYIASDMHGDISFNSADIIDLYRRIYEDLLAELRDQDMFWLIYDQQM